LNRNVIFKVSPAEEVRELNVNARFLQEARILMELSHPSIMHILDAGEVGNAQYLLLEWIEGKSLSEILVQDGPLDWKQVLDIAINLSVGIAELHGRGILHRDIKPSNVIMSESRGPVLIDFGLVKFLLDGMSLTGTNHAVGTPNYMAPEIISGEAASPASDVYSLGVPLHTLIEGSPPFRRPTMLGILQAQVGAPVPRLENIPKPLSDLVARCLSKDPSNRPEDGDSLRRSLETVQGFGECRALEPGDPSLPPGGSFVVPP